jgi:hypothetical protein
MEALCNLETIGAIAGDFHTKEHMQYDGRICRFCLVQGRELNFSLETSAKVWMSEGRLFGIQEILMVERLWEHLIRAWGALDLIVTWIQHLMTICRALQNCAYQDNYQQRRSSRSTARTLLLRLLESAEMQLTVMLAKQGLHSWRCGAMRTRVIKERFVTVFCNPLCRSHRF